MTADFWNSTITACLEGDQDAWIRFVRAAHPILLRIYRHLARDGETAKDLSQQLLLRLLEDDCRRLRGFDPTRGTGFPVYLGVLAGNLFVDWTRSRQGKDRKRWIDLRAVEELLEAPDQVVGRREIESAFEELGKVFPRARLALDLRLDGCSDREIASALGLTLGGAGKTIWEARRRLREILDREPRLHGRSATSKPGVSHVQ